MRKLALGALFVGLVACDDKDPVRIDPFDAPPEVGVCNPLAQSGCDPGQKCTWINDQDNPPIGHVGCAPETGATAIAIGGACTEGPAGPMGYDSCVKGAVCLSGECKQICDQAGGNPTCDANHSCTIYADFLETGGTTVAGVCDPACDPLTQDLKVGAVTQACGSTSATMPTKGCYGYDDYSCAPAGMSVYALTDRAEPRTNASGNPYLNGCAPGFIPFFYEMTGSTKTLCSGFCAALETDNTAANMNNSLGDATAIGKLPTTPKQMGDATCGITKKGSHATSECKFIWPSLVDRTTGDLPMAFQNGPYLDKLGICMRLDKFMWDMNMDMTPETPYPACRTLPRHVNGDMGTVPDDAADWDCQKFSNSQFIGGKPVYNEYMRSSIRIPKDLALEVVRHNLN